MAIVEKAGIKRWMCILECSFSSLNIHGLKDTTRVFSEDTFLLTTELLET